MEGQNEAIVMRTGVAKVEVEMEGEVILPPMCPAECVSKGVPGSLLQDFKEATY